jgi:hypothetical protein
MLCLYVTGGVYGSQLIIKDYHDLAVILLLLSPAFISPPSFADGGKVGLIRTGFKLCTRKRQAGRETLITRSP